MISVIIQKFFFSNIISPSFKQIPYWWKVCRLLIKCGSTKSLWIYSSSTLNRSFFQTKQKYSFHAIASLQVVTDWTLRGGMWLHKKSLKWKKVQGDGQGQCTCEAQGITQGVTEHGCCNEAGFISTNRGQKIIRAVWEEGTRGSAQHRV